MYKPHKTDNRLDSWLEDTISLWDRTDQGYNLTKKLNEGGKVKTPDLEHHNRGKVIVVVSSSNGTFAFNLNEAQLSFWSPHLRRLIDRAKPQGQHATEAHKEHIAEPQAEHTAEPQGQPAPDDDYQTSLSMLSVDKRVFQVFVSFMKTRMWEQTQEMMQTGEDDKVPMAVKVWVLADRLKGPFFALKDEAMKSIYHNWTGEFLHPPVVDEQPELPLAPDVVRWILKETRVDLDTALMRLLIAMIGRPGNRVDAEARALWEQLMEDVPAFGDKVRRVFSSSWIERERRLKSIDHYLSNLGDVTPGV